MSPIFCTFERSFDHHPIKVNVCKIRFMEGDGKTTSLYFDGDHFIVVAGDIDEIEMQIQAAVAP